MPYKVVGGEESVPAVQHARLAACPAGRHHRAPSARPAAPARRREPGVADAEPLSASTQRTHTHTQKATSQPSHSHLKQVHFGECVTSQKLD